MYFGKPLEVDGGGETSPAPLPESQQVSAAFLPGAEGRVNWRGGKPGRELLGRVEGSLRPALCVHPSIALTGASF